MRLFENFEEKLAEIRGHEFYAPYIESMKCKFEEYSHEEISLITYKDFMYFYETGSRAEFEEKYFARRDRLSCAFILYLLYREEKYMQEISNCIWAICTEISWALPAHLDVFDISEHRRQIDIFAAETAYGLAEVYHLIGDELPERIRGLILHELEERTFSSYENQSFWWETLKSNWASVCAGSIGMAYMCAAPERFGAVKERLMKTIDSYLSGFGDDGCCPEGISYWDYGFSFYVMFADMLRSFTHGEIDLFGSKKVHEIALCRQRMVLRNNTTVSFSDGAREGQFYNIGLYSYLKKRFSDVTIPRDISLKPLRGRISSIPLRTLLWSDPSHYTEVGDTGVGMRYFENAKWYINKFPAYSFAAKAGHNREEHNHNDVGSFIFATDAGQILADIGAMEYTRENFKNETRYSLIQNSSRGHSVPIVGGAEQGFGEEYCGKVLSVGEREFSLEMQSAYPGCSGRIVRSFSLLENCLVLRDEFSDCGEICERFVTLLPPETDGDSVKIADARITAHCLPKITSVEIRNHSLKYERVYLLDYPVLAGEFTLEISI